MIKKISILLIMLAAVVLIPMTVLADTPNDVVDCTGAGSASAFCVEKSKSAQNPIFGPRGVLTRGAIILTFLAGTISVFMMVWGGLKFTMSSGEPQKITTAKNTILFASIGIVITISATVIIQFVLKRL